jgi:hypothetical protein
MYPKLSLIQTPTLDQVLDLLADRGRRIPARLYLVLTGESWDALKTIEDLRLHPTRLQRPRLWFAREEIDGIGNLSDGRNFAVTLIGARVEGAEALAPRMRLTFTSDVCQVGEAEILQIFTPASN